MAFSDNMRTYRKERGLTQQQLADALDVSLGVISKWEKGLSTPDIQVLMEMAEVFGVSTDTLLGVNLSLKKVDECIDVIGTLLEQRDYSACKDHIKKSLRRFPNSFLLVTASADAYMTISSNTHERKLSERALELYERSLELFDPYTQADHVKNSILGNIALLNIVLGRFNKGLDYLKENNINGSNDSYIGYILAVRSGRENEACSYLDRSFASTYDCLFRILLGYSAVYCSRRDYDTALSAAQMLGDILEMVRSSANSKCLDKSRTVILCEIATINILLNHMQEAEKALSEAITVARQFDLAPSFYLEGSFQFTTTLQGTMLADDLGTTAMEGLSYYVSENDARTDGRLSMLFRKLTDEEGN